jgi:hypothetical protein
MKKLLAIGIMFMSLTGCMHYNYTWGKSDMNDVQFRQDEYQCQVESRNNWYGSDLTMLYLAKQQEIERYKKCMQFKGYHIIKEW